jgi:trk/ktr system potassium uptake protein
VLLRSVELRAYLIIVAIVAVAAIAWEAPQGGVNAVRRTLFGAVSISTTTGFSLVNYNRWSGAVQLLLLFGMAVGGMAGSSAGGFKTFRVLAVVGHVRRHLFRQLHPRAVNIVRMGDGVIPDVVISRILGFFGLFMAVGAGATFAVAALGSLDLQSAITVVVSSLGNVGPSFGSVHNYFDLRAGVRDVLMVVMLAGRLEIYPVLLGLVPLIRFVSDRLPPRLAQVFIRVGRG